MVLQFATTMPAAPKMSLAIPFMLGTCVQVAWAGGLPVTTCGNMKQVYKDNACCGSPSTEVPVQIVPNPKTRLTGNNPCEGQKALTTSMSNKDCFKDGVRQAGE